MFQAKSAFDGTDTVGSPHRCCDNVYQKNPKKTLPLGNFMELSHSDKMRSFELFQADRLVHVGSSSPSQMQDTRSVGFRGEAVSRKIGPGSH